MKSLETEATRNGVSAGTDMALAYIDHVSGPATASKVQMAAEYYPQGKFYGGEAAHAEAPGYALPPERGK